MRRKRPSPVQDDHSGRGQGRFWNCPVASSCFLQASEKACEGAKDGGMTPVWQEAQARDAVARSHCLSKRRAHFRGNRITG